jgi:hypothetical protein
LRVEEFRSSEVQEFRRDEYENNKIDILTRIGGADTCEDR